MADLRAKIPVEFPRVAFAEALDDSPVALYECTICRALVIYDNAQDHADWHAGELRRNFSGF